MAKAPTFAQITQGLHRAAETNPLAHFTQLSGYWSPVSLRNSANLVPALRALMNQELEAQKAAGMIYDESIHPLELLLHPAMTPTHPTVQRWINAITTAAEEERYR